MARLLGLILQWAPGVLIGAFMVDYARELLGVTPGRKLYGVCQTPKCLPDALQVMVHCTTGNNRLKVVPIGKFAITMNLPSENETADAVRVYVDLENLMGFLQIALPGLLALSGRANPPLPRINARLTADLEGGQHDWTDFFFGRLEEEGGFPVFYPIKDNSRLRAIAEAEATASISEGQEYILKGSVVSVQVLK